MEKDIKTILSECGFSFKKKFGQNFITDKNLLSAIVSQSGAEGCTAVEIGCGAGTLTRALASSAKKVYAFEIDTSLQPVLERTLSGLGNTEVIFKDFLKADLSKLEREIGGYVLVANLPYYVTTPLIMKIMEESKLCKSLTVMVQEEVALRLCAKENTPDYGAITAVIAMRARAEIIRKVPRTMFMPRPNVDSAVVKLEIEDGRLGEIDENAYKKTVHAAFLSRRKTLVNNLMNSFSIPRAQAEDAVLSCGIDLKARGETLSPQDFVRLSHILKNLNN